MGDGLRHVHPEFQDDQFDIPWEAGPRVKGLRRMCLRSKRDRGHCIDVTLQKPSVEG
jgi:hypothetical protein